MEIRSLIVLMAVIVLTPFVARPLLAQGIVTGTVYETATNRTVRDAEVSIAGLTASVRTDSGGNFVLRSVPPGERQVIVRAVGLGAASRRVTVFSEAVVEIEFYLRSSVQLIEKVNVKADAADASPIRMKMAGFDDRRKLGFGRFLTRDDLEKDKGRALAEMLTRRIPGVRLYYPPMSTRRFLIGTKVFTAKAPQCYVRVFIDGLLYNFGGQPFDPDTIDPSTLAGVEFHNVASTPLQYNPTDGPPCGTLLLWTR